MVTVPQPDSISIEPDPASITDEGRVQFVATAHWPVGSPYYPTTDATGMCYWTSSNTAIATVNNGTSLRALALGVNPGTATISAEYAQIAAA